MSVEATIRALRAEADGLRLRLSEAEDMLHAIRAGEVDAIVVDGPTHPAVYTLKGAADPYRLLVEQMAEGALTVSAAGVILYCNSAFAQMVGRPREHVVGELLGAFTVGPAGESQIIIEARGGREARILKADGATLPAYVSSAQLTVDGELVHCLVATDLSRQELRLHHEAIVNSSPDAIFSLEADGTITSWNAAAQRLYAYTAQEAIGRNAHMLFDAEHHETAAELLERSRHEQIAEFDTICVTKDGRRFDVSFGMSPIKAKPDGGVSAITVIARDITHRKIAEEALRLNDRRKDEFIATLAHELRNPLAPIRSAVYVLQRDDGDTSEAKDKRRSLLDIVERQVDHLVRLVDDLLEVSRVTSGKIELRKERCDLAEILRHAIATSQPHIQERGHTLTIDEPLPSMTLDADPVRLAQVFANLLNNAAKYSDEGGCIWLGAERRGDEIIVRVRDNGIGISTEMLPRVFGLFTQSYNSLGRAEGGLGIGLALAHSIVHLHGGQIDAASQGPGNGSEFVVRLPIQKLTPSSRVLKSSGVARSYPCRKILVVDDNPSVVESFRLLLDCLGLEVCVAYDGDGALAATAAFKPCLAFIDIGMPGLDGYETARRIRMLPEGRNIVLVAATGWGQADDRSRAIEAGFDHHLVKPIKLDALEEILASPRRAL